MAAGPTIIATVGADTAPLQRDLKRAEQSVSLFGRSLSLIVGGGLIAAARSVFNFTKELQDQADMLDMTSESWQRLSAAFADDTSPEKLAKAMAHLNQAISDARDGNPKLIQDFQRLNVTFEDLFHLSPNEVLMKIADASRDSQDPVATLAATLSVLGKNGKSMVPDLKEGADAIRSMGDAADVVDQKLTKSVDSMGRWFTKIGTTIKTVALKSAAGWADILTGGAFSGEPAGGRAKEGGSKPDFSSGPIVHKTPEQEKHDHEAIQAVFKEMAETEKEILDYKKRMNDALERQKELERDILKAEKEQRSEQAQRIHEAKQAQQDSMREDFINDPSTHGEMQRRREARRRQRLSDRFDRGTAHEHAEETRRRHTGARVASGWMNASNRGQEAFEKNREKIQLDSYKKLEEISKKMDGWVKSQ